MSPRPRTSPLAEQDAGVVERDEQEPAERDVRDLAPAPVAPPSRPQSMTEPQDGRRAVYPVPGHLERRDHLDGFGRFRHLCKCGFTAFYREDCPDPECVSMSRGQCPQCGDTSNGS